MDYTILLPSELNVRANRIAVHQASESLQQLAAVHLNLVQLPLVHKCGKQRKQGAECRSGMQYMNLMRDFRIVGLWLSSQQWKQHVVVVPGYYSLHF